MDLEDDAQRLRFFRSLLKALHGRELPPRGTFAAGQCFQDDRFYNLKSLHVEGAGNLKIPLSAESASKLRTACEQAPFERGSFTRRFCEQKPLGKRPVTVMDTEVQRCWQVNSSKVTFPDDPTFLLTKVQILAWLAVNDLGLDAARLVGLTARFDKLLLFEVGGHFAFQRDTEKEKGMFGTLIIQIPTEQPYTGGRLVVKHYGEVKEFDCSQAISLGFCYTVFYADCLHELQKIESGTRLCLVFNLVRSKYSEVATRLSKVREALEPWFEAVTEENWDVIKLAIPLEHKYTATNLCFGALKGNDAVIAAVMKTALDQKFGIQLVLNLCLVTKYDEGMASNNPFPIREGADEYFRFENWVGVDNKPASIMRSSDLMDTDIVSLDRHLFHEEPDRKEYEEHHGNNGRTAMEYWYHSAMLVVHPRPRPTPPGFKDTGAARCTGVARGNSAQGSASSVVMRELKCFNPQEFAMDSVLAKTVARFTDSKWQEVEVEQVSEDRKQSAAGHALKFIDWTAVGPGANGGGPEHRPTSEDTKGKTKCVVSKACESSDEEF